MTAATRETKRAIIATLERRREASPREIAEDLGEDWLEPSKEVTLRKMLRRMTQKHIVTNPRYGIYRVSPELAWRGIDNRDLTENAIATYLAQRGGVAKTGEIQKAAGDPHEDEDYRSYDYQCVTLALRESRRFQQDFGRGHWNLHGEEFERLPLCGRWASRRIQADWRPGGKFKSWQEERTAFFLSVGEAFADARGDRSLTGVIADPAVHMALTDMSHGATAARADALGWLRKTVADDCRRDGVADDYYVETCVIDRKKAELPAYLLGAFERGDVELHLAAPVELYRACATLFGVDAARLSRGEVIPVA